MHVIQLIYLEYVYIMYKKCGLIKIKLKLKRSYKKKLIIQKKKKSKRRMTVKGKQKLYIQKKKKVNIYYNKITLSK